MLQYMKMESIVILHVQIEKFADLNTTLFKSINERQKSIWTNSIMNTKKKTYFIQRWKMLGLCFKGKSNLWHIKVKYWSLAQNNKNK